MKIIETIGGEVTVGRNGVLCSYIGGFNENSNPLGGGSKNFINLGGVAENSSSEIVMAHLVHLVIIPMPHLTISEIMIVV